MIGTESCLQWEYEGPPVKETFHIPRSPRPNGIVKDTHALPSGRLFWVHETVDSTSLKRHAPLYMQYVLIHNTYMFVVLGVANKFFFFSLIPYPH